MNRRFQLIKPYVSDTIYEAPILMKCAKKCYKEVKNSKMINISEFAIRDVDTREIFRFKINNPSLLGGADKPNDQPIIIEPTIQNQEPSNIIEPTIINQPNNDDLLNKQFTILAQQITNMDARINTIDSRISLIEQLNQQSKETSKTNNEDVICTMM